MVDIVDKALRMGEGHQLKKLENVAKAVNALEDEISALSDEDLKACLLYTSPSPRAA